MKSYLEEWLALEQNQKRAKTGTGRNLNKTFNNKVFLVVEQSKKLKRR